MSVDSQKPSVFETLNGQDLLIHQCRSNPSPGSGEDLHKFINKQQQNILLARRTMRKTSVELGGLRTGFTYLRDLYEDAWKKIDMYQRALNQGFNQYQMSTDEDVAASGRIAEIMKATSELEQESRMKGMTDILEPIQRHMDCAATKVRIFEALLDEMELDVSKAEKTLEHFDNSRM